MKRVVAVAVAGLAERIRSVFSKKPPVDMRMKALSQEWKSIDGEWRPVCMICGGNCGKC